MVSEGSGSPALSAARPTAAAPAPVAMASPRRPVQGRAGGELVLRPRHEPRSVPRGTLAGEGVPFIGTGAEGV